MKCDLNNVSFEEEVKQTVKQQLKTYNLIRELKEHSTKFTCQSKFTSHGEYDSAFESLPSVVVEVAHFSVSNGKISSANVL